MTATNQTLYASGNIHVTNTMLTVDGASYPVAGIASFYVNSLKPKRTGTLVWGIFGCLWTLNALLMTATESPAFILLALLTGSFAALCLRSYLNRTEVHHLVLRTAGGDIQAVSADNVVTIRQVSAALNQAVALRG